MNKIKFAVLTLAVLIGIATLMPSHSVSADAQDKILEGYQQVGGNEETRTVQTSVKTVVEILLFIIGAISVIMIILGAIKYTVSNGDSTKVTSAKNTIMYAVVGLVVALFAYAIVNFVLVSL
ncbi:MAG: rane protein of unknown function [Candidatus Saccharibacteria bacterium]|jgi:multisubunit Na+/H+ antiporter MnhB subunit|nr:rane protein of unknown function [Candidatus Saccharibacteria bacterium]